MDVYLVPTHKGYTLFSLESVKEEPKEKGLVKKVKRIYEKFVTNNEKVLREVAGTKEGIVLNYSSDIPEKWGKEIYKSLMRKEKVKNHAYFGINFVLAPVTFVAAPFLPFVNWGFAAFFAYKCVIHHKAIKGIKKIEEAANYTPNWKIAELENILISSKDYGKVAERAKEIEFEEIAKFYLKKKNKKVGKVKII